MTIFTTIDELVAHGETGDTCRKISPDQISEYRIAGITTGDEGQRLIELDSLRTAHKGNPVYCYASTSHTYFATPLPDGHQMDLNMGTPFPTVHRVENVKRRSAKGLAAAHDAAVAAAWTD